MIDKQHIIVIGVAALIFICLVILFTQIGKPSDSDIVAPTYTLDFPLMLPDEPGYTGEYLYVNTPRDRWTEEEVQEWFVEPTGENLERLSAANDQLIISILEAAP